MEELIHGLQSLVWGPGMLVFFLGTGIRFTVCSKFFQIRKIPIWLGMTLGSLRHRKKVIKTEKEDAISQFQSFCTALAATLGTGNITGVATALVFGGPGAVFWMWVSAFFGMMTSYAENYLGIRYRYKDQKGKWAGGAMVYMERGLNSRFLAVFFSVSCLIASLGMGNMVQGNSMAKGLETAFGIPPFITGSICMILLAVVAVGGVKRVAALTEKLVPFMAGVYFLGAMAVLMVNWQAVPQAVKIIFDQAFQIRAGAGGVVGYTMGQAVRMGVARGIFSNEAGLGSSVMAHVQSDVENPQIQGMWGMLEVFIDTMVGCTVTALVILVSGVYQPDLYLEQIGRGIEPIDGTTLTGQAFAAVLPWGAQFLSAATALFAFATIAGWSCFGEQTAAYLGKDKGAVIYRYIYILITLPGCILAPSLIWDLSDAFNGMMALPNLVALFFLGKQVKYEVKNKNIAQKIPDVYNQDM